MGYCLTNFVIIIYNINIDIRTGGYLPGYKKSDLLVLYTLTGGVAKYVELFIDRKKLTGKKMLDMFFERDSYFLSEGKNMLVDEFRKDYGIYFSILTLIAQGRN